MCLPLDSWKEKKEKIEETAYRLVNYKIWKDKIKSCGNVYYFSNEGKHVMFSFY